MQTVLQELKLDIETKKDIYAMSGTIFINKINELLEKEKEQIETAFAEGYTECYDTEVQGLNDVYVDRKGVDYYKQTFKND